MIARMGRRLFTAVLPPPDVIDALESFLAPRRDADERFRWTKPEGWHLTTAFMAEVAEPDLDPLTDALAEACLRSRAFGVCVEGGGAFPHADAAKVLWLDVVAGRDALTALSSHTRTAIGRAGVRCDGATYRPHLTVARANRGASATRWLRILDACGPLAWSVTEAALVESHLGPRGSHDTVLERFPLAADETA